MRLAEFIETSSEPILKEWVSFAKSCGPAAKLMDEAALRDHAFEMLKAIVADLRTSQSAAAQQEKSKGHADSTSAGPDTAAEVHGADRAWSGFTIGEMVSEYRALRASVVRLWTKASGTLIGDDLVDLVRFNEAIDQSIAESITRYSEDLDRSKEMFLAVLGHDLRTPLGAVLMSSQFMLDNGASGRAQSHAHTAHRTQRAPHEREWPTTCWISHEVNSAPACRSHARGVDLANTLRHAVDEVEAAHPSRKFEMRATGDADGEWDSARMSQVFANLLGNAAQHGAPGSPIGVQLLGEIDEVVIIVHNLSEVIPPSEIFGIFSPFKRLKRGAPASRDTSSLGLGLFIADRIVKAHAGMIDVQSSEDDGTSFIVRLPRDPKASPAPLRATSRTDRRAWQSRDNQKSEA